MNRKQFIRSSLLLTGLGAVASSCNDKQPVKGSIVGASASVGHLLRSGNFNQPAEIIQKK